MTPERAILLLQVAILAPTVLLIADAIRRDLIATARYHRAVQARDDAEGPP